jgi:hypothetical protein
MNQKGNDSRLLMRLVAGQLYAGPTAGRYREARDARLAELAGSPQQPAFPESEQQDMQACRL